MAKEDHISSEMSLLTDEYRALKAEIASNLTSSRQISGLALTAIGSLIAGGPFLARYGQNIFFLIIPAFFYALTWAQLRYVFLALDMGSHLRGVVVPRMRCLLAGLSDIDECNYDHILSWENKGKSPVMKFKNWSERLLFIPISGANFGTPLLASLCSVIALFVFRTPNTGVSQQKSC